MMKPNTIVCSFLAVLLLTLFPVDITWSKDSVSLAELRVTEHRTFKAPTPMHLGWFQISPDEKLVCTMEQNGRYRYPNISLDWVTTGYSIHSALLNEKNAVRYLSRERTGSRAPDFPAVFEAPINPVSGGIVYPAENTVIEVVSPGHGIVLFSLDRDSIHSLDISPCGAKIAYSIKEGPNKGIWIFFLDTAEHYQLTDMGTNPFWVMNGQAVVYNEQGYPTSGAVLIDSDLNKRVLFTVGSSLDPKRSRDGQYLLARNSPLYLGGTPFVYDLKSSKEYPLDFLPIPRARLTDMEVYGEFVLALVSANDKSGLYLLDFKQRELKLLIPVDPRDMAMQNSVRVVGNTIYFSTSASIHSVVLGETYLNVRGLALDSNVSTGESIKIVGAKINPMTRADMGPDLTCLKAEGYLAEASDTSLMVIVTRLSGDALPEEHDYIVNSEHKVLARVTSLENLD